MALSRTFKEDRLAPPLSTPLSSTRSMSLALCPQVVCQVPQHFRSSEKQATCESCLTRQSICSVVSLNSGMSRAVRAHTRVLEGGCRRFQYGLPIPLFTFCSKLIESVRMMAGAVRLSLLEANLRRALGDDFTRTKFHLCFSVYIF